MVYTRSFNKVTTKVNAKFCRVRTQGRRIQLFWSEFEGFQAGKIETDEGDETM